MKAVVFHSQAEAELEQAAVYYEGQRPGLGREFRQEFEAALDRLLANPQWHAIEINDVRGCPLRRFPYTIYFADLNNRIWLIAVAHQHRRPRYWAERRPTEQ